MKLSSMIYFIMIRSGIIINVMLVCWSLFILTNCQTPLQKKTFMISMKITLMIRIIRHFYSV